MDLHIQSVSFCQLNYPALLFRMLIYVSPSVIIGLAVAMGAEHYQIFEAIIVIDAVAMVHRDRKRLAQPVYYTTATALFLKQSFFD